MSKRQLKEIVDNVYDFKNIEKEIAELINQLDDVNHLESDELDTILAYLHLKVSKVGWHLSEGCELIEVIFGKYKKLLNQIKWAFYDRNIDEYSRSFEKNRYIGRQRID